MTPLTTLTLNNEGAVMLLQEIGIETVSEWVRDLANREEAADHE